MANIEDMDQSFMFDWRSAVLGLCALQLAVIAAAILSRRGVRPAERWLAGFLLVLAGILIPYVIGYAGAYVRWPNLTFLPVGLPLALGPALFGYVHERATGGPVLRPILHLTPAGLQFLYYAAAFFLPMSAKQAWVTGGHSSFVAPALEIATLCSFATYAVTIARTVLKRKAELRASQSRWLWRVLMAFGLLCVVKAWFDAWAFFVRPADYNAQTWMYLIFATCGIFLAVEGWRRSGNESQLRRRARIVVTPGASGANYAEQIRLSGWWREPDLTVPVLARRLGASESSLARAFKASLGCGVAHYLNTLRAEAVANAIRSGSRDDFLNLALDNGFSSKSSFNRIFQARYGQTPSAFRRESSDSGFVDG